MGIGQRLPAEERAGATWGNDRGYLGRRQSLPGERAEATWEEGRSYLRRRQRLPRGQRLILTYFQRTLNPFPITLTPYPSSLTLF